MTRKYINEAKTHATRLINESGLFENKNTFDHVMPFIDYVQRAGATLHTRYENQCNGFPWDKDNSFTERYDRATEKREATLLRRAAQFGFEITQDFNEKRDGAFIRLQGDPRGWPVELIINHRTVRLGDKA